MRSIASTLYALPRLFARVPRSLAGPVRLVSALVTESLCEAWGGYRESENHQLGRGCADFPWRRDCADRTLREVAAVPIGPRLPRVTVLGVVAVQRLPARGVLA